MSITPVEIAIILSPLLSVIAMIYTWFKTRVKEARFIVFDFHITNIKDTAEREGKKLAQITSTSTILNKGDRVGFVRFKRAELKGYLKGSEDKIAFELKQPDTETRSFSLPSGISTTAGFNFETEKLAIKYGWEKAEIKVEGYYITHKGKTKEFILEFIGSSEKKKMWESPKKRKEKTIVSI